MIGPLLSVRFRSLLSGLTAQGQRKKKKSTGMLILFGFLYIYLFTFLAGVMGITFYSLAGAYHSMDLDWLYFSVAGLMALGLSVFGSVFTTQSQLYDAKDNELLLSMPIPPRAILLSRVISLLALDMLFAGIVMIPAMVVYGIFVKFTLWGLIAQLLTLLAVCLLAQAISRLLGWLLHLLLSRMNKSLASMLYMVLFLGVYFAIYSNANRILQTMAAQGQAIAEAMRSWIWPLFALGLGCTGSPLHLLAFLLICVLSFALVYLFLSKTFLHTATAARSGPRRKLRQTQARSRTPLMAVTGKELGKFLHCPVYLTNMGLGVVLTVLLPILGILFRDTVSGILVLLDPEAALTPLLVCAALSFSVSTACISTPSVSLEGKNIWILKSMPLSGGEILKGKLLLHIFLTVPVTFLAGLILAAVYGCSPAASLLCGMVPGLLALLSGLVGMWAGLQWAKLDYISEAYPCKQSLSVLVTMFSMMGIPVLLGLGYGLCSGFLSAGAYLLLCAVILSAVCLGLYRVIMTWGVRKWDSL